MNGIYKILMLQIKQDEFYFGKGILDAMLKIILSKRMIFSNFMYQYNFHL